MGEIVVTDHQGQEHRLQARSGDRVMEVIRDAGLPIRADCGGCCACATCHVYVDADWLGRLPVQSVDEIDTLDLSPVVQPNSRLSCQIEFTPDLDGLTVTLSPDTVG